MKLTVLSGTVVKVDGQARVLSKDVVLSVREDLLERHKVMEMICAEPNLQEDCGES